MQGLSLQLDRGDASYVPGEPITGKVTWDLEPSLSSVTVRLLWRTSGKGSQDFGLVGEEVWDSVSPSDSQPFTFPGVDGPYSFSGKLITVSWIVEAYAGRQKHKVEQALMLSPTGTEVRP